MSYAPEVQPFLNTSPVLDKLIGELWSLYSKTPDMTKTRKLFLRACIETPNVGRLDSYVPHCFEVSRRCEETSKKIVENYPILKDVLNPAVAGFAGLIEDSVYLIGGNGKDNPNGLDSNPIHEILTLAQMKHLGYNELADGMAMHGVAPQILAEEHKKGRLQTITFADKPSPMLDVLTGIDMLCTTYYLPLEYKDANAALKYRLEDIVKRRAPDHPLTLVLERGGRERVTKIVSRIDKLMRKEYSESEVKDIYFLQ